MEHAKQLLIGLLDYTGEQAKLVEPDGFQVSKLPGPKFTPLELANLPAFRFNVNESGVAIWLRIERLEALPAPGAPANLSSFISVSSDPSGQSPNVIEASVETHLAGHPDMDAAAFRVALAQEFDHYACAWWGWS